MEGAELKTKTAKSFPVAWNLDCPECGGGLANPDGSFMWLLEHLPGKGGPTQTVKCTECGAVVKLPKK